MKPQRHPNKRIQSVYFGSPKACTKRGLEQKLTNLPHKLENTKKASYKRRICIRNQTSPRTKGLKEKGLQSTKREPIIFKHHFVPLISDCPHQTQRSRLPQLWFLFLQGETNTTKNKIFYQKRTNSAAS